MAFVDSIVLNLPGFTPSDKSSSVWWRLKNVFFFHTKVCWRSCSYTRNTLTLSLALHMLKYISLCCVSFNTAVNLNGKLIKASTADSCTSSSRNVALSPRELPHAEGREGEGKKKQVTPTHTPFASQLWLSVHISVREEWLKTSNDKEHPSLGHPLTGTTAADLFQANRIV